MFFSRQQWTNWESVRSTLFFLVSSLDSLYPPHMYIDSPRTNESFSWETGLHVLILQYIASINVSFALYITWKLQTKDVEWNGSQGCTIVRLGGLLKHYKTLCMSNVHTSERTETEIVYVPRYNTIKRSYYKFQRNLLLTAFCSLFSTTSSTTNTAYTGVTLPRTWLDSVLLCWVSVANNSVCTTKIHTGCAYNKETSTMIEIWYEKGYFSAVGIYVTWL